MADIEKLRVGDELRISVRVTGVVPLTQHFHVIMDEESHSGCFIGPETIKSAEHIPAPKQFKRGDFVRRTSYFPVRGGGLVLSTGLPDRPDAVRVHWPESNDTIWHMDIDLEHDETPK